MWQYCHWSLILGLDCNQSNTSNLLLLFKEICILQVLTCRFHQRIHPCPLASFEEALIWNIQECGVDTGRLKMHCTMRLVRRKVFSDANNRLVQGPLHHIQALEVRHQGMIASSLARTILLSSLHCQDGGWMCLLNAKGFVLPP